MATLVNPKGKGLSIQWQSEGGKRQTLYLGKCPKRWAEKFIRNVERLIEHVRFGEPLDHSVTTWLSELEPKWRTKLADKGLAAANAVATLGDLIEYSKHRAVQGGAGEVAIHKIDVAARNLFSFFGETQSIHAITPGDAEEYARWLRINGRQDGQDKKLGATTACKQLKTVNGFFRAAVAKEFCHRNPFKGIAGEVTASDAQQYVPVPVIESVLEHCHPALAIRVALARFAGLRHPTEVDALEIEWVNLPEGRFVAFSQKNQRYDHKRWRTIPIDPLLKPYLEDAIDRAPAGATHVAWENRGITGAAWRNALERACKRAAVAPWRSMWHSLRGSRAVDLLDAGIPEHTVCVWQNTGARELQRHYLRPTANHFARINGIEPEVARQAEPRVGEQFSDSIVAMRGDLNSPSS